MRPEMLKPCPSSQLTVTVTGIAQHPLIIAENIFTVINLKFKY
jgi:hypothetical protein